MTTNDQPRPTSAAPVAWLRRPAVWVAALLLLTWALYARAITFGLVWDDPIWFGRVIDRSVWALIEPQPTFQYYRPGTLLYNRLFVRTDGTYNAPLLHLASLGWHMLVITTTYALARRLRLGAAAAVLCAALVALHPFNHQAIAWMAPQQPIATALQQIGWLSWLSALQTPRARRRWRYAVTLATYALALTIQEATVPLVVVPLLLWLYVRRQAILAILHEKRRQTAAFWDAARSELALLVALGMLSASYFVLWLNVPRLPGYTDVGVRLPVIAYLAQPFAGPLLLRPFGYDPLHLPDGGSGLQTDAYWTTLVLAVAAVTTAALLAIAAWRRRGALALLAIIWALAGIAPGLLGLEFGYVRVASRLLYFSMPPLALLWVGALWHARRRAYTIALALLLVGPGALTTVRLQQLYTRAVAPLRDLTWLAQPDDASLLLINFPDHVGLRRPPLPIGYWGLPVAPIITPITDFLRLSRGVTLPTTSYALPATGSAEREAGPYLINMRGQVISPEQLVQASRAARTVHLTQYSADGNMHLQRAGALAPRDAARACLVTFGGHTCLTAASVAVVGGQTHVRLRWRTLGPAAEHDTTLLHAGPPAQPPVQQADGDAWLNLLPRRDWPADVDIVDDRWLATAPPAEDWTIRVGMYNWVTGQRLPAVTAAGQTVPDGLFELRLGANFP